MRYAVLSILMIQVTLVSAQFDSAYYQSYPNHITGRYYFSKKYTSFIFNNREEDIRLRYRPNTTLNMGVGATYKWATLNLAYGFGFLNPRRDDRGDTKYLDLQLHNYGRKIIVDVFGQFYRGFYLSNDELKSPDGNYYTRPDIRVREFGVSAQYVLNHSRFSYRAAFLQNEWQKKSAGTLLIGWEFFMGTGKADSSIVPAAIDRAVAEQRLRQINFVETGPSIGYAYTLIIHKHFFVTGSASLALDFGTNRIIGDDGFSLRSSVFSPNTFARFFTGYNSDTWAASFTFVNQAVRLSSAGANWSIRLNTGNFRVNLIYRFKPSRKTTKVLKTIIETPEEIKEKVVD